MVDVVSDGTYRTTQAAVQDVGTTQSAVQTGGSSLFPSSPSPTTPSPRNGTYMPTDPDKTAFGVIVCISVPILLLILYMSVFGRRMRWTAIRWHVINCAVWGMLHLASIGSFAEKAPFPNWIRDKEWSDKKVQVECLTRSIFPAGMFFIYIEQMLLTCSPRLANNRAFNFIFAALLLGVVNGLVIFCFAAQYMNVDWWYNPIELFNLSTYMLFCTMTFVYFFFCLIGSCCCCCLLGKGKSGKRTAGTFVDMWMLFPYAVLPNIMYGPSFGVTSVGFVMKVFMKFIVESGLMEKFMGGSGDENIGPFSMQTMIDFMMQSLQALPWFVFFFPVVQAVLAIICITPYREQFFFLVTCGRCFHQKKSGPDAANKEWALGGIAPYPAFPRPEGEPLKMEHATQ